VTVIPCTPIPVRASRTSSSLKGLMMAMTIFIGSTPAWARPAGAGLWAVSLAHSRAKSRFAEQRRCQESSAVPVRATGCKCLETKGVGGWPHACCDLLPSAAQTLVRSAQFLISDAKDGRVERPAVPAADRRLKETSNAVSQSQHLDSFDLKGPNLPKNT